MYKSTVVRRRLGQAIATARASGQLTECARKLQAFRARYPHAPFALFGKLAPGCKGFGRQMRSLNGVGSRLGDEWVDAITGQPVSPDIQVPSDLPPLDPFNLPPGSFKPLPSWPDPIQLPNVSANTLLAAARLPNAPTVVRQAAAQYAAANPISSWFSGQTIAGVPNYLLAGGAGVLVLVLAMAGKKR